MDKEILISERHLSLLMPIRLILWIFLIYILLRLTQMHLHHLVRLYLLDLCFVLYNSAYCDDCFGNLELWMLEWVFGCDDRDSVCEYGLWETFEGFWRRYGNWLWHIKLVSWIGFQVNIVLILELILFCFVNFPIIKYICHSFKKARSE